MKTLASFVFFAALIVIGGYFFPRNLGEKTVDPLDELVSIPEIPSATSSAEVDSPEEWKSYTVPEVGLQFSAPQDLTVTSEVQKNESTGQPTVFTLYVQNARSGQAFYQLYGIMQWDTPYPDDVLELRKEDLTSESIQEITLSGKPALRGQIKGVRNRFVTYIRLENGLLSLFTAEPTPENEQLSSQIISTFKFDSL